VISEATVEPALPARASAVRRRMPPGDRREALLDATAAIVAADGISAVSMDTVAEAAGVSRPLLYRYFRTSNDVLGALYAREIASHDERMRDALATASSLESAVEAQFRVWLRTMNERGDVVGPLFRAEMLAARVRRETTEREREAVTHFARLARRELDVSRRAAVAGAWMQIAGLQTMLDVWALGSYGDDEATAMYVAMTMGGWLRLAGEPR
jgi:AcrR family transcriptional regulator